MFFDIFSMLCGREGKTPTGLGLELGFSRSTVSNWKSLGIVPRPEALKRIANHFGVTTDYLLGLTSEAMIDADRFSLAQASAQYNKEKDPDRKQALAVEIDRLKEEIWDLEFALKNKPAPAKQQDDEEAETQEFIRLFKSADKATRAAWLQLMRATGPK